MESSTDISLQVISLLDDSVCRICLENDGLQVQVCKCLPVHITCLAKQQSYKAQDCCELCLTPYHKAQKISCAYISCCSSQYYNKCCSCFNPLYYFVIILLRASGVMFLSLFTMYFFIALLATLLLTPLYILQIEIGINFISFVLFVSPAVCLLLVFLIYKTIHNWPDIVNSIIETYTCCCGCLPCTIEQQISYTTV